MRLIVMYDLPMNGKYYVKEYSKFRTSLLKEGYVMIQYSVYSKICINFDAVKLAEKRLQKFVPKIGNIRMFSMTEKQYMNMKILSGKKYFDELLCDDRRLVEI